MAAQQAQLAVPDKPGTAERKQLAEDMGTVGQLRHIKNTFNPAFVGPLHGRGAGILENIGMLGTTESDFRAQVSTLRNQVLNMRSGAAISPAEFDRIEKELPDTNNSTSTFQARLLATTRNALRLAYLRRDVMAQTGISLKDVAKIPAVLPRSEVKKLVEDWVREKVPRDEIKERVSAIDIEDEP
jgi:hypothetical protein